MYKYLFGPVASRRLGLSLGVNLLADCKECNLNCVYCELGRTLKPASERKMFAHTAEVADELIDFFHNDGRADFVTFSGNGEPCLALNLGDAIDAARVITNSKIALITNATLFYDPAVRRDACKADVVMPSIDAGTEPVFKKLNRPNTAIDFGKMIDGLITFSGEFKGEIWAEVLLVKGINDSTEELAAIKAVFDKMERVARIQVNTVVRSAAEAFAGPVDEAALKAAKELFGPKAEIIGRYTGGAAGGASGERDRVLNALTMRPENAAAIALIAGMTAESAAVLLEKLASEGLVERKKLNNETFYIRK